MRTIERPGTLILRTPDFGQRYVDQDSGTVCGQMYGKPIKHCADHTLLQYHISRWYSYKAAGTQEAPYMHNRSVFVMGATSSLESRSNYGKSRNWAHSET